MKLLSTISAAACCAERMKASTRAGSFLPGALSTPLTTSTPQGRKVWIACFTFSGPAAGRNQP
jgi:hypothetical protein